jgi:hypothetical protein
MLIESLAYGLVLFPWIAIHNCPLSLCAQKPAIVNLLIEGEFTANVRFLSRLGRILVVCGSAVRGRCPVYHSEVVERGHQSPPSTCLN